MLSFPMKAAPKPNAEKRARSFGAWLCLLAAILLWSPLWAAALQANGVGCCDGALCTAHPISHRHAIGENGPGIPASTSGQPPMDCGHGTLLESCSMSCCHDASSSFVTAIVFVVLPPMQLRHAALILPLASVQESQKISRFFDPLSPPPRASSLLT